VIDGSPTVTAQNADQNLRSVADWGDMDDMNISDSAGNLTVATNPFYKHPTDPTLVPLLKAFYNNSASAATVVVTTITGRTTTLKIPAYGWSGKLPSIATVTKAGTSDSLTHFWQYQKQQ